MGPMQTSNSPPLETISEGQSSLPDSTGQHGCVEKNVQPIPSNTVGVNSSPSDLLMDEMKIPISDMDAMIGNIDIDGPTEPSNSVASAEPFSQVPFPPSGTIPLGASPLANGLPSADASSLYSPSGKTPFSPNTVNAQRVSPSHATPMNSPLSVPPTYPSMCQAPHPPLPYSQSPSTSQPPLLASPTFEGPVLTKRFSSKSNPQPNSPFTGTPLQIQAVQPNYPVQPLQEPSNNNSNSVTISLEDFQALKNSIDNAIESLINVSLGFSPAIYRSPILNNDSSIS